MNWAKREKLGEILLAEGVISVDDLQFALRRQKETGMRLGEVLVSLGAISEDRLIYYIGEQLGISSIELERYFIPGEVLSLLDEGFIREKEVMPLFVKENVLHLAMVDPLETGIIDSVVSMTGRNVEVYICSRKGMSLCTAVNFPGSDELPGVELTSGLVDAGRALRALLFEMQKADSTELQMEGKGEKVSLRLSGPRKTPTRGSIRLDIDRELLGSIKSYLGLETGSEQGDSEDLCVIRLGEKEFSARLSALETLQGESLSIKLVNRSMYLGGLYGTGMSEREQKSCESLLSEDRGLIIVASPAIDGRTLTMYALLKHLSDRGKTVYLIEKSPLDILDFAHQVLTRGVTGRDMTSSLGRVMKHAPDVVAVGENVDAEILRNVLSGPTDTALTIAAMNASRFSEVWIRLSSMTGDPEYLSESLIGSVSLAYSSKTCPECTTSGATGINDACAYCGGTGFGALVPHFQIMRVTSPLRKPLQTCYDTSSVDELLREHGIDTKDELCDQTVTSSVSRLP